MGLSLWPSFFQRACAQKQGERESQIAALSNSYQQPLSFSEQQTHALSLFQLVSQCRSGILSPLAIMQTYGKRCLRAHKATNCLTDFMFDEALQTPALATWTPNVGAGPVVTGAKTRDRSLMGVPVSIKDTVDIQGHDTTIGYARNVNHPSPTSSAIVRLLQDAGAIIHAKTTVPVGLISIETSSDIFGTTTNPYNGSFTSGASTGGGAALVSLGGSKIEIGSDLAGSVRLPAHFCGVWSLKGSAGRFPGWGHQSSLPGLEAIPIVVAPLAGSLNDLEEFWKRVVDAKPWLYDHTCIPLPWERIDLREAGRKLKWGIIWDDGIIPPTPACKRALVMAATALRKQGHEVVDFNPPNVFDGLKLGYQLIFADGGSQVTDSLLPGESVTPAASAIFSLLSLPRLIKRILAFFSSFSISSLFSRSESSTSPKVPIVSQLYDVMHACTVLEERKLVAERDAYRSKWHNAWEEAGLDFVLTVPHPLPAVKVGDGEKISLLSAGYTFLFSLLDYTAGVLPVTQVDRSLDMLPLWFKEERQDVKSNSYKPPPSTPLSALSPIAQRAYSAYDPQAMHGLPVGIQIAGKRLEEEKVLQGMVIIEHALKEMGSVFEGLPAV